MAGVERLLGYAPRWLQGLIAREVFGAIGEQLDDFEALDLADQLFIATATTALDRWERDFGLPTIETDSLATRRARVLARRRGQAIRTEADFAALVRDTLQPAQSGLPYVRVGYGRYAAFQPADSGFPTNFDDVEALLALVGPAHLGLWVAPWDSEGGLPYSQLERVAYEGFNTPRYDDLNGAALNIFSLAELDAMSITEIDALEM